MKNAKNTNRPKTATLSNVRIAAVIFDIFPRSAAKARRRPTTTKIAAITNRPTLSNRVSVLTDHCEKTIGTLANANRLNKNPMTICQLKPLLFIRFKSVEAFIRNVFERVHHQHIDDGVEVVAGFLEDAKLFVCRGSALEHCVNVVDLFA